jgi:hypothetical protein
MKKQILTVIALYGFASVNVVQASTQQNTNLTWQNNAPYAVTCCRTSYDHYSKKHVTNTPFQLLAGQSTQDNYPGLIDQITVQNPATKQKTIVSTSDTGYYPTQVIITDSAQFPGKPVISAS